MKCLKIFIILLQGFIFIASERPKYRDDYRYEKVFNAFYKIHLTAATWSEGRLRCEAEGAELMVPESLDEADAMPLLIAPVLSRYDGIFIGIHDLYSEGSYVTIKGWQKGYNGDCYILHEDPQTWHQAYATCLSAGGHLMVLNSKAEAKYLRELFKNVPERRIPDNFFAFLGYSDLFQRLHYRTIFGQHLEEAGYTDWDFKCTENSDDVKPLRCGGIHRSGLLNAGDCDIPAVFFCEKPVNKTKPKENLSNTIHGRHLFEQTSSLSTTTDVVY